MIHLFYTLIYKVTDVKKKKSTGDLRVQIENLAAAGGAINVALFQHDWLTPMRCENFPVSFITQNAVVIEDLPYGNYAIRVFHDKNCNGKPDTNQFGYIKESIGYSGDGHARDAIPSLDACTFTFSEDNDVVKIRMCTPRM